MCPRIKKALPKLSAGCGGQVGDILLNKFREFCTRRIIEFKCVARARVHAASNSRQWHFGLAYAIVYVVAAAEVFHCGDCPFGFDMDRSEKRDSQEVPFHSLALRSTTIF